jgi:hypothetical protein
MGIIVWILVFGFVLAPLVGLITTLTHPSNKEATVLGFLCFLILLLEVMAGIDWMFT